VTCCATPDSYCSRVDAMVGLAGVHVVDVVRPDGQVRFTIETPRQTQGCRLCGVVAHSHGRRTHLLRDIPCSGSVVVLVWRQRTWSCPDQACPAGTFTEELASLARRRATLTTRAARVGDRSAAS
jgi:transposase